MKKLIFILAIISSISKAQSINYFANDTTKYKVGDSIPLYVQISQPQPSSQYLVEITDVHNRSTYLRIIAKQSQMQYLTSGRFAGNYAFKILIPDTIKIDPKYPQLAVFSGSATQHDIYFHPVNTTAIETPFTSPEKSFDFYNQMGLFIKHCKYSELSEGLYICQGSKYIKN